MNPRRGAVAFEPREAWHIRAKQWAFLHFTFYLVSAAAFA